MNSNQLPNVRTRNRRPSFAEATALSLAVAALLLLAGPACNTTPATDNSLTTGTAAPSADANFTTSTTETVVRDIEEADIVKIDGSRLYALNTYKGLLIVDVTNPDAPALLGRYDLRGRGVEMYIVGSQVCVLLSADWYIYMAANGFLDSSSASSSTGDPLPPEPEFLGSQLAIVNVSDPTSPTLTGKLNLAGYAAQSRRVGDIIYIVGTNYIPYDQRAAGSGTTVNDGFVASVSVADPANIAAVERKTFSGNSLEMHVSTSHIFTSSNDYDSSTAQGSTHLQVIDITDPAGAITLRGSFDAPGYIGDRFFMDEYEDVFRIVTDSWGFGFTTVKLYTFDLTDLDNVVALGQVEIIQDESARAVRFDGPRGYVVTYYYVDPLFVIDLHDPANPTVTGQLEVPGFSTYLEPRGTRLIAMGTDNTEGNRPALAYYNVEDPANPSQLSRVILGPPGGFTSSEAVFDEKAFKIIDELGLIVIPFKHVDASETDSLTGTSSLDYHATCKNAVQLVDFNDSGLTQRGWFEHKGIVQRVGVIGDRVFALSQAALQTVNISDRDNPTKVAQVDFFTDEEVPFWDECSGWYPWGDGPVVYPSIFDWLFNLGLCGASTAVPTALLSCCLLLVKFGIGPRRRRR